MQQTRLLMGMPITVAVIDSTVVAKDIDEVFVFFKEIDNRFSTYKTGSEISRFNRGELPKKNLSSQMQEIFSLAEKTRKQTNGYFDIHRPDGSIDPSGVVKGWAICQASEILRKKGMRNFYVDAGGDIQTAGKNAQGSSWQVGIKNPFVQKEIVKVVALSGEGIATSGTYIRGQHIYNPLKKDALLHTIVSVTVIGQTVLEADLFATAAFAMQERGIMFLEKQKGIEGFVIDKDAVATMTSGFTKFLTNFSYSR